MKIKLMMLLLVPFLLPCRAGELGTPDIEDIEYPEDEPPGKEEIALGKLLFFEPRLSAGDRISCASCHNPDLGFGDGLALGRGVEGNQLGRHTPHLYNLAWSSIFFWDGRAGSLEEQALGPIEAEAEMNMDLDKLISKLAAVPYYRDTFKKVYPDEGLTRETLGRAIAAFERSLVSDRAAFDRYLAGDKTAMSPAAVRGMALFTGKAGCIKCHSGPNFTDDSFHNIGVGGNDPGRFGVMTGATLKGAFKTPGLRNVALTSPYMHDGSLATLEEVMRFYNSGGKGVEGVSVLIQPLALAETEIFELVAFMGALTDPVVVERPRLPE
ncbi:MAG: cytochrome c peroxidase [Acidobacteriota bacterium]|nr:cytochrome c peroxidase [Acidobacteriota bacterium]